MKLPRYFSDQAITLKRFNYKEADRIITVFFKTYGKLSIQAKGVRKTTSRKGPHLEPFSHSKLHLVKTKFLPLVTQAETIQAFPSLREQLATMKLTFQVGEILDKLLPEQQPHPHVFSDLLNLFGFLQKTNKNNLQTQQAGVRKFQLTLLDHLGYGSPTHQDDHSIKKYFEYIIDSRLTAGSSLE